MAPQGSKSSKRIRPAKHVRFSTASTLPSSSAPPALQPPRVDAPASLRALNVLQDLFPSSTPLSPLPPPPTQPRAIDVFSMLPSPSGTAESPVASTHPRAIDLMHLFPSAAAQSSGIAAAHPEPTQPHAIDLLNLFPTTDSFHQPRPTIRLPKRAKKRPEQPPAVLLPQEPASLDMDISLPPSPTATGSQLLPFIYHTNDLLATRQSVRSWAGGYKPEDWVLSREELHAEQVDRDRALPEEMDAACYPQYAISPGDMESLHRYLLVRYPAETFEEYVFFLALFRNTRAIEAQKARKRYDELRLVHQSVESTRLAILSRLQLEPSRPV